MTEPSESRVTELLKAWSAGQEGAFEELTPLVFEELKRVARHYMHRERRGGTLQTTVLVNEAYLRLVDVTKVRWQDRAHFFAVSAQIMRRILVEAARSRLSEKRGGGVLQVTFDEGLLPGAVRESKFLALDEALQALALLDERKAHVVELRFFGGLSVQETAYVLKISEQTVYRDWRLARSWLLRELSR